MAAAQVMQCMEVWGGNALVDSAVTVAGLDAWVYSKPYGQADGGGDVYYLSSCATGRIARLLLADVTGHGAAVCDAAGQLRGLMRRFVNYLDQGAFVRAMNDQFAANARAGCYATALVTTFFGPTGRLSLCNAGHPAPLVYRSAARQWGPMEPGKSAASRGPANLPLGILRLGEYDHFDARLQVGDLVLCYTDSLVEARDPAGELLGQEGVIRLARGLDPADPRRFITDLLAAIAELAPGNLARDDVTVLLFRPNGHGAGVPIREKLRAPLRLARSIVRSLRPGGPPVPWPDLHLANLGGIVFRPLNRMWRGPAE